MSNKTNIFVLIMNFVYKNYVELLPEVNFSNLFSLILRCSSVSTSNGLLQLLLKFV